jgi:hypothetical protein
MRVLRRDRRFIILLLNRLARVGEAVTAEALLCY